MRIDAESRYSDEVLGAVMHPDLVHFDFLWIASACGRF
jgi:hypothetical protein